MPLTSDSVLSVDMADAVSMRMRDESDPVVAFAPRVEKTPKAVREALDPDLRVEFEREFQEALARAAETYDLEPVLEVVEEWWPQAQVCAQPGGRARIENYLKRRQAGLPVETVRLDLNPGDPDEDMGK